MTLEMLSTLQHVCKYTRWRRIWVIHCSTAGWRTSGLASLEAKSLLLDYFGGGRPDKAGVIRFGVLGFNGF